MGTYLEMMSGCRFGTVESERARELRRYPVYFGRTYVALGKDLFTFQGNN